MKLPGYRLRAIAARVCSERTMERCIDPAIADLQAEFAEAVAAGRRWRGAAVWILGHLAVIRALALHAGHTILDGPRSHMAEDRRTVFGAVMISIALAIVGTLVLVAAPLSALIAQTQASRLELGLYLVPQAIPLAIPVGLTLGTFWSFGRRRASGRSRALMLAVAFGASLASFVVLGWIMPTANHAFRVAVAGRTVPKGDNELTLGELRRRLDEPRVVSPVDAPSVRRLAVVYHTRWVLGIAPLLLTALAIAVTRHRTWSRILPIVAGCTVVLLYGVLLVYAQQWGRHTLSPAVAAWLPNAAVLLFAYCSAARRTKSA